MSMHDRPVINASFNSRKAMAVLFCEMQTKNITNIITHNKYYNKVT